MESFIFEGKKLNEPSTPRSLHYRVWNNILWCNTNGIPVMKCFSASFRLTTGCGRIKAESFHHKFWTSVFMGRKNANFKKAALRYFHETFLSAEFDSTISIWPSVVTVPPNFCSRPCHCLVILKMQVSGKFISTATAFWSAPYIIVWWIELRDIWRYVLFRSRRRHFPAATVTLDLETWFNASPWRKAVVFVQSYAPHIQVRASSRYFGLWKQIRTKPGFPTTTQIVRCHANVPQP